MCHCNARPSVSMAVHRSADPGREARYHNKRGLSEWMRLECPSLRLLFLSPPLPHHLIWEYLPLEKEELDASSQLSGASLSPPSLIPTGSQDGHPHPPARGLTQLCSSSLVHTSRKPKSTRLLSKASDMKETQPTHTGKNHLEEIIHKRKKTTKPEEALISLER